VNFGNDCVIDGHPQFHTFENMMLKVKRTQIHDGCAIGVGSTVMGGAVIERDTTILPLSLVLKEMNLTPATYGGSPAEIVSDTNSSAGIQDATRSTSKPHVVDNTDWLKAAAIILVLIDHFGYFFMENDEWWAVLGRFAAPIFFFLVGYSKTRSIPLHWIGLGVMLTLLDASNADWDWVAPNILLSFVLIRFAYRYVSNAVERYPWISVALLVTVLIAILPIAAQLFDYGAEGWLWALFGLLHRQYVDSRAVAEVGGVDNGSSSTTQTKKRTFGLLRLLTCAVAAVVYVWQEQLEFEFEQTQLIIFVLGVLVMSVSLSLFLRGSSRFQPPEMIADALRFIGRHTLEIYAIQLAASEIIVWFVPSLAP
jgi:peptidoglycan/LPS O-acetylase OafA/YrhL